MNIEPKFKIGDKIFIAESYYGEYQEVCPDCVGVKTWTVETPIKENFEIPCGTCLSGYFSLGFIIKYKQLEIVKKNYTISGIRLNTTDKEHPISYVCEETYSNGGGYVYYAESVFDNENDAILRSKELTSQAIEVREEWNKANAARNKKKTHGKPSFERRKIKELEKEIKNLDKIIAKSESQLSKNK